MNKIDVLVVADATAMRDEVVNTIEHEADLTLLGVATTPSDMWAALRGRFPDMVLINEAIGGDSSLTWIEELVNRYPGLNVVAITREGHMDFVRKALMAGARGFVTIPATSDEMSEVLRQIYRLELTRRTGFVPESPEEEHADHGTMIAIFSPKGGVGKTTLTANLGIALALNTKQQVALVDSNPQYGHLGLILSVHGNYSIMDLLGRADELEPELVQGMMASHSSGVRVLLAPEGVERADAIPPQAMAHLLSALRSMFDWTVVDTWPVLTEGTLDVLEAVDRVLMPVLPDVTCLRDTQQFLALADSLGYPLSKFDIVINRATRGGLDSSLIKKGLKRKVLAEIPQDDPLVTYSLNRGIPLVISHKRSPVSKAVMHLAEEIATGAAQPVSEPGLRIRMKRLLGTATGGA